MEKLLDRIESMMEKQFADLEAKPVRTIVKFMILYWLGKTAYKEIKEDVNELKKA